MAISPSLEYQTFEQFLSVVQPLVAPEDLGEAMVPYYRDQVGNALADLQTLIPWIRDFNLDTKTKADVHEFCAASIFQGPIGKVSQIFAYKPGLDCRKYYYKRVSTSEMDCWVERQRCVQCTFAPPPSNIYDTPYCNYTVCGETACDVPYLTGTEDDCKFKSLDDDERIFSVGPDYKIYAAPRFPCDYKLLVQWQGIRRRWDDSNLVLVDQQIREAVVNYVEAKISKKERDFTAKAQYENDYAVNLRMLRFRYHDEQDTGPKRDCTAAIEQLTAEHTPLYDYMYPPCGTVVEICTTPAAPTNLNVTNGPGIQQLTATWTDNATNETGYEFRHRNVTQDLAFVDEPSLPPDSVTGSFFDLVALDQDVIDVQIRAVNGDCVSEWVSFPVNIQVNN
jgi:hypothetical protein